MNPGVRPITLKAGTDPEYVDQDGRLTVPFKCRRCDEHFKVGRPAVIAKGAGKRPPEAGLRPASGSAFFCANSSQDAADMQVAVSQGSASDGSDPLPADAKGRGEDRQTSLSLPPHRVPFGSGGDGADETLHSVANALLDSQESEGLKVPSLDSYWSSHAEGPNANLPSVVEHLGSWEGRDLFKSAEEFFASLGEGEDMSEAFRLHPGTCATEQQMALQFSPPAVQNTTSASSSVSTNARKPRKKPSKKQETLESEVLFSNGQTFPSSQKYTGRLPFADMPVGTQLAYFSPPGSDKKVVVAVNRDLYVNLGDGWLLARDLLPPVSERKVICTFPKKEKVCGAIMSAGAALRHMERKHPCRACPNCTDSSLFLSKVFHKHMQEVHNDGRKTRGRAFTLGTFEDRGEE